MKRTNLFIVTSLIIFFICALLLIFEVVSFSFHGFGVDSTGKLYVGAGHKIDVFENGKKVNTIRNLTSRGYVFTIRNDDTILLASGTTLVTLDLQGEIIEQWESTNDTISKLRKSKSFFGASNGETYTASWPFGRLTICCGSEIVYKMPLFDFTIMLILVLDIPCFVLSIVILSKKLRDWYEFGYWLA